MGQTHKNRKQKLGRRLLTWWPSRVLIEFWVWSIATFMMLPGPRWAYFWARVVARIGWALLPRVRGVILRNIDLCLPELSEAERTRIGRESLKHNIYTFLDLLLVPRFFAGERWRDRVHLVGDCEKFFAWLKQPRSSFNMSAHFGNWELLLAVVGKQGVGYSVIVRPPNLPLVAKWLERYRKFASCELIEKEGALKALLHRIRQNRPVALLADQNGGDFAPMAPFFGVPASWQTEFSRLVPRANGRVAFGHALRRGDKFDFDFYAPEMHEFSNDATPEEIMAAYRQWLEARIREHPEQYFWMHKRFKARPKGAPDRYQDLGKRLGSEDRARLIEGNSQLTKHSRQ